MTIINPLKIGNISFNSHIVQGPLAGVSTAPFRSAHWQFGQPAFTYTEMISCKTIIHQRQLAKQRFMLIDPSEGPVCFQLATQDPSDLAEAVKVVTQEGAQLIDLNCGCPVRKIRQKQSGSALLADANKIFALLTAMKNHTHVPIGLKIRVDGNSGDGHNDDVIKAITDAGADYLVVHGRHWTEHYETPCRYDQIRYFVQALSIPVIGNGDVSCMRSFQQMLSTGCAGVMIARAGVGQPWLSKELMMQLNNESFKPPTLPQIGELFLSHIHKLQLILKSEKFAILHARNLAKYYARSMPHSLEFCNAINKCETFLDFSRLCGEYFNEANNRYSGDGFSRLFFV